MGWSRGLPLGLRAVPDPRRMAGRPHRAAPRAHDHRHVVGAFTSSTALAWNAASMWRAIPVRDRRGRRIPHRHALAFALDAARRTRLRAGHHARRLATGRGADASAVGAMITRYGWRAAFIMFGIWGLFWAAVWYRYYRDMPDEHARSTPPNAGLIARHGPPRRRITRSPWRHILSSSTLWYSRGDVFLLRLLPRDLSRLVPHVSERIIAHST